MRAGTSRRMLPLAILAVSMGVGCVVSTRNAGDDVEPSAGRSIERTIRTADGVRRYLIRRPAAVDTRDTAGHRSPLVLMLHGSNSDGRTIEEQSGMDAAADRYGVTLAYPDGARSLLGRVTADWNAGDCCGYAHHRGADDVGYLRAIIDDLVAHDAIDPRRVYVAGFSDGGRMAYRAACDLSDRVAAIAVVSGSLRSIPCRPEWPVALLAVHGTADTSVPYDDPVPDSIAVAGLPSTRALPPAVRFWSRLNGCDGYAEEAVGAGVARGTFACARAPITLYTLEGGTHGWPTMSSAGDATSVMQRLSASEVILRFFQGQTATRSRYRERPTR